MQFEISSLAQGARAEHHTPTATFWSTEQRMGGAPTEPNPLELLLGSLSGCMNVVLQMIAQERGFGPVSGKFQVTGDLDPRGFMGDPSIPPYFQRVRVTAELEGVPEPALQDVRTLVGQRCPVHRLLEKAGIPIEEDWRVRRAG